MDFIPPDKACKCRHLKKSFSSKYLEGPKILGFVCINPEVKKEYTQAQFSSLDICCVCEHMEE